MGGRLPPESMAGMPRNTHVRTMRSLTPIHLREILLLGRRYRREDVERALKRALADGTATAAYVRKILERDHPGPRSAIWAELPRGLSLGAVDPGSSEAYEGIFQRHPPQDSKEDKR